MKKTNAQFAMVVVGVLLLHLAAATALMKSARTDEEPASSAGSPLGPTYHSKSDAGAPLSRGPGEPVEEKGPESRAVPDAFADTADLKTLPPPPIPPKNVAPAPVLEKVERVSPTRRLTVNQLLAADSTMPKVKPGSESTETTPASAAASVPKVEKLPSVPSSPGTGPRKIRSLSGD